jgi:hypothetical protein
LAGFEVTTYGRFWVTAEEQSWWRLIKSLIVTSQLPVASWHEFLGEPTLADAILDRLLHNSHRHNSHRLVLSGPSRRKATTQEIPNRKA